MTLDLQFCHISKRLAALLLAACWLATAFPAGAQQLSDEEARRLTSDFKAVLAKLEGGSDEDVTRALDIESAIKDAADGIGPGEAEFLRVARSAAEGIGPEFVRKTHLCSHTKIIKSSRTEESVLLIVRFDYGDAGFGYAEFELAAGLDGRLRIVDLKNHSTGMTLVETLRVAAAPVLSTPEAATKLFVLGPSREKQVSRLMDLLSAMNEGDHQKGVNLYAAFDRELKSKKDVALLGFKCALLGGQTRAYLGVLEEFAQAFPSDKSLTYLLIEHYFLNDRYAEALRYIDSFEAQLGVKDASLMALKAEALIWQGQSHAGVEVAAKAVALEPGLEVCHWALLMGYCALGRFDKAVEVAKTLEEKFEYRMDEDSLSRTETYSGLVESHEYRVWRESMEEE